MAVVSPPIWIAAGGESAESARRVNAAAFGLRGGVVAAGDLAVTQFGTPNMSVNVATGQVVIPGTQATYQGSYVCENRGTINVAIPVADATNGRYDLVVGRVRDAGYSGATNSFAIEVVTGTPAASPSPPAVPANSWALAQVYVAAAITSITNAAITDLRTNYSTTQLGRAAALGGTIVCTSTSRPVGVEGLRIYETDTKQELAHNGTAWVPVAHLAAWPTWTPSLVQSGAVTKTVSEAHYEKVGRRVTGNVLMVVTGSGTAGQPIVVGLPVAMAGGGNLAIGSGWVYDASGVIGYTGVLIRVTSTTAILWAHSNSNNIGATPNFALANSDQISYHFSYQSAA